MGKRGKHNVRLGKYAPPKGQVALLQRAYAIGIEGQYSPFDRMPPDWCNVKGMEEGLILLAQRILKGKRIR